MVPYYPRSARALAAAFSDVMSWSTRIPVWRWFVGFHRACADLRSL